LSRHLRNWRRDFRFLRISEYTRLYNRTVNAKAALRMLTRKARAKEMRQRIHLGGLAVKAGLHEVDDAFLLGVLIDAAERINDPIFFEKMRLIGMKDSERDQERALP